MFKSTGKIATFCQMRKKCCFVSEKFYGLEYMATYVTVKIYNKISDSKTRSREMARRHTIVENVRFNRE